MMFVNIRDTELILKYVVPLTKILRSYIYFWFIYLSICKFGTPFIKDLAVRCLIRSDTKIVMVEAGGPTHYCNNF